MNQGRTVLSQLTDHLPRRAFRRIVARYGGDHRVRSFSCWDQFLVMAFAQLTFRESLRDIEACLRALGDRLYAAGIRGRISRSTLADANERRDWRIYAEFGQKLIAEGRRLYSSEPLGLELEETVYALDSTTIDLCLGLSPWARFRYSRGAVKLHTLLDLRGPLPASVWVTPGRIADVRLLDQLLPEPGSIYVLDRGYVDFARLRRLDEAHAVFVIRARGNLQFQRLYSRPVDRATGLICDQTIRLTGPRSAHYYPEKLRRVRYRDAEKAEAWTYLTNDFTLPAFTVAELYRYRWQVELFFKWIKQHLRIRSFCGTSLNAVKIQIWIAISVYVLVAIVRKRLAIERELYTLLQILSLSLFEKVPLAQALTGPASRTTNDDVANQFVAIRLITGHY
jgi:hypothetical protein